MTADRMKRPARLLLVDDHTIVRQGLRMLLGAFPEFEIVGEADTGTAALSKVGELAPDLVLLDLSLPDVDGVEVLHQLRDSGSAARVVVLSMHTEAEYVRPAMQAGAVGYLVKGADVADLVRALRSALRGEPWLSPSVTRVLLEDSDAAGAGPLSDRETVVLRLVARGKTSREIAAILGISAKTVENHRQNLKDKLDIHDVAGLTRYAMRTGLIVPE